MATTDSPPAPPGSPLPDFSLCDVRDGKEYSQNSFLGASGLLVAFICRHCPYVVHMRGELARIATEFSTSGLRTVGICSNDAAAYPEDAPDRLREMGLPFPVLHDEAQEAARAFGAACTPDLFLYDNNFRLFYRGRLDSSSPGNGKPLTGSDLRHAIQNMLAGDPPPAAPSPSVGCSIKWKPV